MKELAFLKITISIFLIVGPFGVGLYINLSGKSKVAATASAGPATSGYATCFNWSASKPFGCDPRANNGITGEFKSVNPLAGTGLVLSLAKDSKGNVESSAGVTSTITDPTGTVGLRIGATSQLYSNSSANDIRLTNPKAFENLAKLAELKRNKTKLPSIADNYRYELLPQSPAIKSLSSLR